MNPLRRALAVGLRRLWRPPPLGRTSHGGPAPFPPGKASPGGRRGRLAASMAEEEEFVFPEYVPEEDDEEEQLRRVEAAPEENPENSPPPRRLLREARRRHPATGRADPSLGPSGVRCSGCGAELHCRDAAVPGFLPSEKYLSLVGPEAAEALRGKNEGEEEEEEDGGLGPKAWGDPVRKALEAAVCQRCWLLLHHRRALQLEMPREAYARLVSAALKRPPRHGRPHLVLCMVDLLDLPDAVLADVPGLAGAEAHIFVLGNKVDLLPADAPTYLKRLEDQLRRHCAQAGLVDSSQPGEGTPTSPPHRGMVDVHLISAKTGYGIETLISKLQRSWKLNGDVYLVGAANSGKSTLFNALLRSDYCKSNAAEVIHRATISPFPGTTLNLLKFPIINPTPYRILRRQERLKEDSEKSEEDLSINEQQQLNVLKKQGYLIGRIGRTFKPLGKSEKNIEIDFDVEALSTGMEEEPSAPLKADATKVELTYNEVKDCRWFYDTPGIIKDECVLNLLTEKEIKYVLPTFAIVPRTYILKPGTTLFLGALGRIDYLQGNQSSWFSVVANNWLPVHITSTERADAVYQKHAGQPLLKVPMGGEERMSDFPPLVPQEVTLEGIGTDEAIADIKLSSAGWVAVTAHSNHKIELRCYTPEGIPLTVRQPPLLPYIVRLKGERVKGSSAYRTKRPPSFVQNLKSNTNEKKYRM